MNQPINPFASYLIGPEPSSKPEISRRSSAAIGLQPDRVYGSYPEMMERERALPADHRIEAVSIVTPNHLHAPVAITAFRSGFHVICDKPAADSLENALAMADTASSSGKLIAFTHSQTYCDEVAGICKASGIEITELSTHLQGQLVAVHPAYEDLFNAFAPPQLYGNSHAKAEWAADQVKLAAKASKRFGCTSHATFSGALLWQTVYPWPQHPAGLVEEGLEELARRWLPILNVFDENGVDACYELHSGEDLHDGVTFDRFLDNVKGHKRANLLYDPSHFVLQQLDYLSFIDIYRERIKAFHVKDAEFRPTGRAAFMAAMRIGSTGRGASARREMGKSTSVRSSRR